ncbi:MAG: RES family NAD+ phosphorylase, partial [Kosmotoga sp.]
EWVLGEGSTPIMAAFTHVKASRFNTDYFGAYYASKELKTAIYETVHHRERFYSDNKAPAGHYHMRVYIAQIRGDSFCDIQNKDIFEKYYNPDNYQNCQKLVIQAKKQSRDGIIYKSIRHTTGTNVAVLRPKAIVPPVRVHKILSYYWDGKKISFVTDLGKGKNLLIN